MDRIDRFVLLPELSVFFLGLTLGYAGWFLSGADGFLSNAVKIAVGFLGVELLSLFFAHSPELGLLPLMTDFAYVSLLFLVAGGLTQLQIERTISASALICGVISLFGILQYLDVGRHLSPSSGLPSSTLGHRNIAAAYAAAALPFIVLKFTQENTAMLLIIKKMLDLNLKK